MNSKKLKHTKDFLDTNYKNISTQHKELMLKLICLVYDKNYIVKYKAPEINTYIIVQEIILALPEEIYFKNYQNTIRITMNISENYDMFLKEINKNVKIYKKITNADIFQKIETKPKSLSILDLD